MAQPRRQKGDMLVAHLAIGLAPRLSGAAKQTAAAILEHHNGQTGRCDPGNDRLALLLGIDARTVRRATQELVAEGLFEKQSHAGRHHTAAYVPNWPMFRSLVANWQRRFKAGVAPEQSASRRGRKTTLKQDKVVHSTGHPCPIKQDKDALQTLRRNPLKEPMQVEGPANTVPNPAAFERPKGSKGLRKKDAKPSGQTYLMHPVPGGKRAATPSPAEAADAGRQRALARTINALPSSEARERAWLAAGAEAGR